MEKIDWKKFDLDSERKGGDKKKNKEENPDKEIDWAEYDLGEEEIEPEDPSEMLEKYSKKVEKIKKEAQEKIKKKFEEKR